MSEGARVLVVSADRDRREDWAELIEKGGGAPIRCAGPTVSCALLCDVRCPLHDEAVLALYDRDSVTVEFRRLLEDRPALPRLFVATDGFANGRHRPVAWYEVVPARG